MAAGRRGRRGCGHGAGGWDWGDGEAHADTDPDSNGRRGPSEAGESVSAGWGQLGLGPRGAVGGLCAGRNMARGVGGISKLFPVRFSSKHI